MRLPAKSLRRWARRTTLALILGALSTIAVAWTFAALPTPPFLAREPRFLEGIRPLKAAEGFLHIGCRQSPWRGCTLYRVDALPVDAPESVPTWGIEPTAVIPGWLQPALLPWYDSATPAPPPRSAERRAALTCGWPFRAMFCAAAMTPDFTKAPTQEVTTVLYGHMIPARSGKNPAAAVLFKNAAVLPTHPLWPGFLADTLLYALPWLALLTAPPVLRRTLRRRRGHCPTCNYDRLADFTTPCPECGDHRFPSSVDPSQARPTGVP